MEMEKDQGLSGRSPLCGSGSRPTDGAAQEGVSPAVAASIPNAVRDVIAEANNSLYGSQGFFLSTAGGEPDRYHLSRPIEEMKAYSNRQWRRAELFATALRAIVDFDYLGGDRIDLARLAREALASASAIEARSDATAKTGAAEGESAVGEAETPNA